MKRNVAVAYAMTAAVIGTGIVVGCDVHNPAPAAPQVKQVQTDSDSSIKQTRITLDDGLIVTCLKSDDNSHPALSCDWARATR